LIATIGQGFGNIYVPPFNPIIPAKVIPVTYIPAYMWQGAPLGYASLPKVSIVKPYNKH